MKTVWEYSSKTEVGRLLHCAHQISIGFYRANNFIVLPYNPKVNTVNTVTFPDLPYNSIPRFWNKVKSLDVNSLPIKVDSDLAEKTSRLLSSAKPPSPNFEKIELSWKKAETDILKEIYKIIPAKKGLIEKIIIFPTSFGTSSSFDLFDEEGKLMIYLRDGQGISTITEAILTSLTRADVYNDLAGLWQESELLADWLILHSSIEKVLKKFDPKSSFVATIKGSRAIQTAKLSQESELFYKKLGIPSFTKPFGLNGLTPEINKKPMENLSIKERLILKKLIESSNSVVSFDAIADEVFKEDDDFSLSAISKTVERLRNKLEANGISGSYIQTLRGKGYLLKN